MKKKERRGIYSFAAFAGALCFFYGKPLFRDSYYILRTTVFRISISSICNAWLLGDSYLTMQNALIDNKDLIVVFHSIRASNYNP